MEYELLVLLSRRGREEEQACARNTAAARWRPAEARVVVARAKEDSSEGKQDRNRGRVTRGDRSSRRWSGSGNTAAGREVLCTGGSKEQESRGVPEEEEIGGSPGT
jgi:hypothetical protein